MKDEVMVTPSNLVFLGAPGLLSTAERPNDRRLAAFSLCLNSRPYSRSAEISVYRPWER